MEREKRKNGYEEICIRPLSDIPEGTEVYLCLKNIETGEETPEILPTKLFTYPQKVTESYSTEPQGVSWGSVAWGALWGNFEPMKNKLIETFVDILTPLGDSFLDMLCVAMGEVVTIDGIVYNRIQKLDINYFKDTATTATTSSSLLPTPLKDILSGTVSNMYDFFRKIVIAIFMVMLIYIGVKILFTSTAEKKANYKGIFMAWVMGVIMLFFFPYVMKYTILLNDALCTYIGEQSKLPPKAETELHYTLYGTPDFVKEMLLSGEDVEKNAMLYVREIGATYWQIPLILVYFVFIGQILALLILYYKRVFMIGFLIAIFPIVTVIYPLNRIGDVKMNPFGVWYKEFAVNVFVQSFHAATFKVISSIGIEAFNSSQNWLFMMICVLFLFDGEKIIRAIFNAKSSANTIGDLAMAAAITQSIVRGAGNLVPKSDKKDSKSDDDDEKASDLAKKERVKAPPKSDTLGAESNKKAAAMADTGTLQATSGVATGTGTAGKTVVTTTKVPTPTTPGETIVADGDEKEEKIKLGRNPEVGNAAPSAMLDQQIEDRKKDSNLHKVSAAGAKLTKFGASVAGATTMGIVEGSLGAAVEGERGMVSGISAGIADGKKIGNFAGGLVEGTVDKIGKFRASRAIAREYMAGDHDSEMLMEADKQVNEETKKALREAYAKYARAKGMGGSNLAEIKFINRVVKRKQEDTDD